MTPWTWIIDRTLGLVQRARRRREIWPAIRAEVETNAAVFEHVLDVWNGQGPNPTDLGFTTATWDAEQAALFELEKRPSVRRELTAFYDCVVTARTKWASAREAGARMWPPPELARDHPTNTAIVAAAQSGLQHRAQLTRVLGKPAKGTKGKPR